MHQWLFGVCYTSVVEPKARTHESRNLFTKFVESQLDFVNNAIEIRIDLGASSLNKPGQLTRYQQWKT